ncbi:4'-phosphopantetheinyl transferase family protein [Aegicerativicinus sediminis]|uniref:4'-phosphopantetheinyl transferase family protein n=1 Tax=Aegicerativicinus sediminis TaxID=2893202 RepID=UPI001E636141|nr:4'-phosphopantetheinyl transferase family protein [Aegicerativicinus sediminis]
MPLYKSIKPNPHTEVKVWKITESFEDLLKPITLLPDRMKRVDGMKSEIHRRGFLSVRHLLAEFGYEDKDLYYDQYGKPHLTDGKHISITHSFEFSAVVVSDEVVGIDIEMQRSKIIKIGSKFCDFDNYHICKSETEMVRKLTVIWCIKESLYKSYATPGLSFKEHCQVIPFMLDDGQTLSWILYEDKACRYTSHYFEFEGYTCAYIMPS